MHLDLYHSLYNRILNNSLYYYNVIKESKGNVSVDYIMSSTVPSIDSEEYRVEKENRVARTLAKRREIRDRVEQKYYDTFCDKVNNIPENKDRFISNLEISVQLIENLRDDIAGKILKTNDDFYSILPLLKKYSKSK